MSDKCPVGGNRHEEVGIAIAFRYTGDGPYYVELQYAGRRETFCTHSLTRSQAAYTATAIWRDCALWLRAYGIKSRTPIHTLRKEIGSLVAQQYGIHAASTALRHAGIAITSSHYIGKKSRTAVGLGPLLANNVISISAGIRPSDVMSRHPSAVFPVETQ